MTLNDKRLSKGGDVSKLPWHASGSQETKLMGQTSFMEPKFHRYIEEMTHTLMLPRYPLDIVDTMSTRKICWIVLARGLSSYKLNSKSRILNMHFDTRKLTLKVLLLMWFKFSRQQVLEILCHAHKEELGAGTMCLDDDRSILYHYTPKFSF